MQRLAVLASGSGSLFQALIDADIPIAALVTDRDCGALARAKAAGIPSAVVPVGPHREQWDHELRQMLDQIAPELIVSAGFMRILGPEVLAGYQGRIINTHPALLPSFPGAHAVRDALAAGVTVTGCTVHYVDSGVDTGPVIEQQDVPVLPEDDETSLHERIKHVERRMLVQVVRRLQAQGLGG